MTRKYMLGLLGGVLLGAACASAPKPTEGLVSAQGALRAADEVGAAKVPQAQLHAQLAKEQVDKATKLMEDGDNAEAARVLGRAKADAELAIAITRKADAERGLEQAQAKMSKSSPSASTAQTRNP